MKKYNAPQAELICFRPAQDLAIEFGDLVNLENMESKQGVAAEVSVTDIKIGI